MSVKENLELVLSRVRNTAKQYGRDPASVRLTAVSKQQSLEKIKEALDTGVRVFGENRVQEAQARWRDLKSGYPDLELRLIGPLQTNKVKEAVALFDAIETLDREKLARALAEEMKKQGRHLSCFIQVNTSEELQKAGAAPQELPAFLRFCRGECGLKIEGLMCIPPLSDPPSLHFALLAKLAKENGLENLSMGMSDDFEKAIPLGATHIRLGTAVFGARNKSAD